jgi:Na+/melibiose symporter-like transporter
MFRRSFFRHRRSYSPVGRRRPFLAYSHAATVIVVAVAVVIILHFTGYLRL